MIFSHSGDVGDTIFALSTIATMGGGELVLTPSRDMVREAWTPDKLLNVISLFESQPYISRCRFGDRPDNAINLDVWRRRMRRRENLADTVALTFNQPFWDRERAWLVCEFYDDATKGKAIIHRSPRYHSRDFCWREVVNFLRPDAVFVGSPEEHAAFTSQFGDVPYYPTPTLLALARALAGCRMFVGNQSTPRALAEGLKKRVFVEEDRYCPNTHFVRAGAYYGRRDWRAAQLAWTASFRFE